MDRSASKVSIVGRNLVDYLVAVILFGITVLLSLVIFFVLPESAQLLLILVIVQNGDASFIQIRDTIVIARMVFIVLGGMVMVAVFFGGLDYHFIHRGTRRSYKVFAWTIGIEATIIVVHQVLLRLVLT